MSGIEDPYKMSLATSSSTLYKEGSTLLLVPSLDEPKMIPAFFNPRGAFVRDVSIIVCKAYLEQFSKALSRNLTFADSLAGIGARGIRVANEVEGIGRVFLNDINSSALEFGKKSAEINSLEGKCIFSRSEVCSFLLSRIQNQNERFDFVDVDPFGSPSDFVDCAIRAVRDGGLLSLTATDSAVLCGVYPRVALRKYLGLPLRTDYCHEVGMRLLFGLAAQTAMRLEAGILPIFCHHDMHYFRVYFSIKVGNAYARDNERKIGFILHCFKCGFCSMVTREEFFSLREQKKETEELYTERKWGIRNQRGRVTQNAFVCPVCGSGTKEQRGRIAIGGPLWIDKIQSSDFVRKCREISDLPVFSDELDLPLYYDLNSIQLKSGSSMPKITKVLEKLKSSGFTASRTRLNPNSLRTDATMEDLRNAVWELAR